MLVADYLHNLYDDMLFQYSYKYSTRQNVNYTKSLIYTPPYLSETLCMAM